MKSARDLFLEYRAAPPDLKESAGRAWMAAEREEDQVRREELRY